MVPLGWGEVKGFPVAFTGARDFHHRRRRKRLPRRTDLVAEREKGKVVGRLFTVGALRMLLRLIPQTGHSRAPVA
jgi:hypothetical protein